jgi:hypothetical protein
MSPSPKPRPHPFPTRPLPVRLALIAIAALAPLPGCNILGPAYYFVHGPEKAPAVYTLDKKKTAVFFIDDRTGQASRPVRETIGQTAEESLLNEGVVKDMVQSRAIQTVIARERFGRLMTIADTGKAVQADVVIYCWLDRFGLTTDNQTYSPGASFRVKVIDTATGERLFPTPGEGPEYLEVNFALPTQQGAPPSTTTDVTRAELDLARYAGRSLAQLFFEHEITRPPSKLEGAGSEP